MTTDIARRRLLQSGVAAAALGALPGLGVIRSAHAVGAPSTIVAIHLDGGNDTLNTVIPYANPEYYRLRGSLAIPAYASLKLDGANALHPSLPALKALWDRNRVAIVHGVGYPGFDYSHFQAKQIYWTADPTRIWRMGWLGRATDAMVAANPNIDILTAMTVGTATRPLQGQRFVPVQVPTDTPQVWLGSRGVSQTTALKQLLQLPATTSNQLCNRVLEASKTAALVSERVRVADAYPPAVIYPNETFALNLKMTAQLLRADSDIRIVTINQGSYDHHVNLVANHLWQLNALNAGLKAFTDDLDSAGLSGRVLILLYSEFGRRVIPNAQAGVDHGAAQAMILIGPGVRRGITGTAPLLTDASMINNGNLPMQVDFRSVYATMLAGWLGTDPRDALGGLSFPTLPFLL